MNKKLLSKIEKFLEERRESDAGGYAPCSREDMDELHEIVHGLIEAKFRPDCDGDVPVQVILINRTVFEYMHGIPLPYTHKAKTVDELDDILSTAACNVHTAAERLNQLMKCRKLEAERIVRDEKAALAKGESAKLKKAKVQ